MVSVSDYLVLRLQMRSEVPTFNKTEALQAWREAEQIRRDESAQTEHRYYEDESILLISRNGHLKTVLRREYAGRLYNHDMCEWCGKDKNRMDSCKKCNGFMLEDT